MLKLKNYSNYILKDISFSLEKDENLLILGENGAGKSTLAKVLSNLIKASNLFLNSKNINFLSLEEKVKIINYIPSQFEIFDEYMTLFEYLKISLIEEKSDKDIEKVINFLNLQDFKNSFCINLSSGEKQLLLLASAILHNAQITIFDELTANLDLKRVKEVFNILNSDLLKQKIIITHNLDFAYSLKNYKVLFLEKGSLKFFGQHKDFFNKNSLDSFYDGSLKLLDSHLVLDL
ncbi:ATP-binding cassette domain-containing protein [Arcobacter porcinus]|uniref:Iron siderophore ABC transporter, ATP-binding protein n=1 Tax=Arcobacter porcinus TaxID=1935204 RepID=A0A5C2HII7_9BACT|nr:ATP-binding cassette domain-containing protein [Arcobacter porcinus]OCL96759.1 Glutamine transport ATP-binding protein GlnQ [Aliarcobacter thereius]QEP40590.1 iron siderophore ABC transporter, ATP-binding protein [Arcobacter porcinus]